MQRTNDRAEQRAILTITLTPGDHGRFVEAPFEVTAGTERVSVSCEVQGYEFAGQVVDLGLVDQAGSRGWSGGARAEFWVERDRATPGYLPGELRPGRWAVRVASNRVPPDGCAVTLTVTCTPEKYRWLRGDLHLHSVHSDGRYELSEVLRLSEAADLDFVALTDHNTSSQNLAYPRESRLFCIPGLELTTYRGHCNILGVAEPLHDFRVSSEAELHERLREARQRGARIGINHPFKDCDTPGCRWEWGWDVDPDWVEVWNGPWMQCNKDALDWWQGQLASGRRLAAVGGSDTHRPNQATRHGTPTCRVWSRSRAVEAILEAVVLGRLSITCSPEGPAVDLRCGEYVMGDEVEPPHADDVRVEVSRHRAGDIVKVVSEQGPEREVTVAAGDPGEPLALALPAGDRRFYRVEVWRYSAQAGQMQMAAISNPIYFKR